ncbi:hypothetical protein [Flavobacterium quisquiliarum]|uniref:Uncharacterized protein n=1 Tax=Flavobacterium quisquiliarum TaxID=1834436 RepID=A0ABV8W7D6_9FLAO|nr:hypothetical protein [Flavobacterium quisquiliarum]MBW1654257.1 hypothetical protein [Flavobacterium quisquiliarum]NWL00750.1 hypothetical protein [Flavobacterium collinsii]
MKIFSTVPEGNQMADLEPARYFNLAIEQIQEAEEWLRSSNEICQALLIHVDAFVHFGKRYPEMAKRRIAKLNCSEIKKTFDDWYERVNSKIPAKYRDGIKTNADELFKELEQYGH